jgi:hypothetical protein
LLHSRQRVSKPSKLRAILQKAATGKTCKHNRHFFHPFSAKKDKSGIGPPFLRAIICFFISSAVVMLDLMEAASEALFLAPR